MGWFHHEISFCHIQLGRSLGPVRRVSRTQLGKEESYEETKQRLDLHLPLS